MPETLMPETFQFSRYSRTPQLLVTLMILYGVLAGLYFAVDAAGWIVALLALPTIPAAWDYWRDIRSGLSLGPDQVEWYSGQHIDSLALEQIDHARFDTRWDFSVRVTLILQNGSKLRLPPQVLPPRRQLEPELQARGVRTERHHFRLS
ncbi:hypothetical protein [Parasedimentitalea psychrophila]|uniref:Uncharacterized protein n=1 Tax=Parasedimentitalea psychrophila TaxID=2997337 RepID=A0A9Y2P2W9_9RHOB|nr:hypothetical protein [Parasedimentitalea psychrophila]WIY25487.1 hypothetical protein QPJ95_00580 [Parasedimentitalea psychrophila]